MLPLVPEGALPGVPEKELTKEEKELEQKMIKVIESMPASV